MITSTLPLVNMIHSINHTQYQRVCVIDSYHNPTYDDSFKELNYSSSIPYYNDLTPAIYFLSINGNTYYFDLYIYISIFDRLYIDLNSFIAKAEIYTGGEIKTYFFNMYKKINSDINILNNTFNKNDGISIIVINGESKLSQNISPTYDNPIIIYPKNNIKINTSYNDISYEKSIKFTQNLKSLPNGKHDTCIIDSNKRLMYYIMNLGSYTLKGSESIEYIPDYDTTDCATFFVPVRDMAMPDTSTDSSDSIRCSHLVSTNSGNTFIETNTPCITLCDDITLGNGFLFKLPKNILEYDYRKENILKPLKNWLTNEILKGTPFTVEYILKEKKYNKDLLDNYDIHTIYPITNFSINNNENINGISIFFNISYN